MGMLAADQPENVDVEVKEKDVQEIAALWIQRALTSLRKEPEYYHKLIADLRDADLADEESSIALSVRLRALSQKASFINEHEHQLLLSHVFRMSFWNCNDQVANVLFELIVNLAVSNNSLVKQALDMLVRNFLPPSCGYGVFIDVYTEIMGMKKIKAVKSNIQEVKAVQLAKKDKVLTYVHNAIQEIAKLVPMVTAFISKTIVLQRMPHKRWAQEWNVLYLESMLELDRRLGRGRSSAQWILLAVVDRLIEMDVEIRWEDILQEEESSKVYLFDMELDENEENPHDTNNNDPCGPGKEAKIEHESIAKRQTCRNLGEVADTMDMFMEMTLEHLENRVKDGYGDQIFATLMVSFEATILNTYKSKFTQFLIFYLCALAPTSCGVNFASRLCSIFLDRSRPQNTRMSAAAYLASYLARAKFVPLSAVTSSLDRLVHWCSEYEWVENSTCQDVETYGVFYSACQAVMYILCFRMKELAEDPKEKLILRNLKLQSVTQHKLNPLKFCLHSVTIEFLRQARLAQLVNANIVLESSTNFEPQMPGTFGGANRLDMFFPFDPYLLKNSDRFIRPNFRFWSMVQSPDEEHSDIERVDNDVTHDMVWDTSSDCSDGSDFPDGIADAKECSQPIDCSMDDHNGEGLDAFQFSMECMSITPPTELPKLPANLLSAKLLDEKENIDYEYENKLKAKARKWIEKENDYFR